MGMVALKCPACGANIELDDSREFGFCNYCGTKVVQDKIVVEHQGSVKVDNSEYVEKFLQNARRAKEKEDWEEVEKYYNLVEQNDPTNIEAIFYSAYGKARLSMVDGDKYKRKQICNAFCNSIYIIDDNYDVKKSEENQKIIIKMHYDLFEMYGTSFVYTRTTQGYSSYDDRNDTYGLFALMAFAFIDSLKNIIKVDDQLIYHKIIYKHYKYLVGNTGLKKEARREYRDKALSLAEQIHEQDSSFEIENIEEVGGCYVATAVYGSYDCPEVWTLRRFRDNNLAQKWYGRAFIHIYYAISPTIIKCFGETEWFKKLWRGKLDKMVKNLNSKGVENTPYNDTEW